MKRLIALAAVPLLLASCVQTSITRLDNTTGVIIPTDPNEVKIYLTEKDVPKPFKKVAVINATSDGALEKRYVYDKLRKDAASLGANGILVNHSTDPSAGAQIAGAMFGYSAQRKGEYVAVKTKR